MSASIIIAIGLLVVVLELVDGSFYFFMPAGLGIIVAGVASLLGVTSTITLMWVGLLAAMAVFAISLMFPRNSGKDINKLGDDE